MPSLSITLANYEFQSIYSFRCKFVKKIRVISIFYFFWIFSYDFIVYAYFTYAWTSSTVGLTDDIPQYTNFCFYIFYTHFERKYRSLTSFNNILLTYNDYLVANFVSSLFWRSINISRSYRDLSRVSCFLTHTVYTGFGPNKYSLHIKRPAGKGFWRQQWRHRSQMLLDDDENGTTIKSLCLP